MVLAFALEIVATFVRSDLKLPEAVYDGPAIYLLLAIWLGRGPFPFGPTEASSRCGRVTGGSLSSGAATGSWS